MLHGVSKYITGERGADRKKTKLEETRKRKKGKERAEGKVGIDGKGYRERKEEKCSEEGKEGERMLWEKGIMKRTRRHGRKEEEVEVQQERSRE